MLKYKLHIVKMNVKLGKIICPIPASDEYFIDVHSTCRPNITIVVGFTLFH